ncbi:MAG: hypothetical protein H7202_03290, partial [Pedobacter sp.]|nr:hypothetical protein [Pedobacter sp.]
MIRLLIALLSFTLLFTSCKNVAKINAEEAGDVITSYLKGNQEYKTT